MTQTEIDAAAGDMDAMLRRLADETASEADRMAIVDTLRLLPDQSRIPPLVRMLIATPEVAMRATCTITPPTDHAAR